MLELIFETVGDPTDGWLPGEADLDAAVDLGARRRDVDAIYTSDLGRALETVAVAFFDAEAPIFHDWRLRECDYGALNGAPAEELEALKHLDVPYPGGESYRDVVARVASFLDDVRARADGKRVLAVSHSAALFAVRQVVNGVPLEELVEAPFEWQPGWVFEVG